MAHTLRYEGLTFVHVAGAAEIRDFHISTTTVTQDLWRRVVSRKPAAEHHSRHPATHVSWDDIKRPGGFLDRLNASAPFPGLQFRLPTEAEWEYAARGGPHASDGFTFSGSDDIDEVAWYCQRFSFWRRLVVRVLGWKVGWRLVSRPAGKDRTHVHEVALKKPNQLGLYDMTGNVWEWCEDACHVGERRLRGGCHHNWDIHCTNSFRYSQPAGTRGPSIGFRLALA